MASNYTVNYGLCQWEPGDPFLRAEFNGDNAALDAALHRVDAMAAETYRALPNLAHNLYYLLLREYYETKYIGYRKAMLFDGFVNREAVAALTGGAVVRNDALCLDGVGATGSMTTHRLGMGAVEWTRCRMWVRFDGGTVVPSVDGHPMTRTGFASTVNANGESCFEYEFTLEAAGSSSASIRLDLDCGNRASMRVFDYGVIFL